MNRAYQWPGIRKILPDMLALAGGLAVARVLGWNTTDLVWSLWLSSLVLGYLTIVSIIGGGVYIGIKLITHKEFKKEYRLTAILIGTAAALLFLSFFSLHFCGFHAGHAVFLSSFFPIKGLPSDAFSDAFMNPILLWKTVFNYLLSGYGAFLIFAIIAERQYVFVPFIQAVKTVREKMSEPTIPTFKPSGVGQNQTLQKLFYKPYINVIRMHLLIFFFAVSHMLKLDSFVIYVVVYAVYFFPWKTFTVTANEESPTASKETMLIPFLHKWYLLH